MSYYGAFEIQDTSGIEIPANFVKSMSIKSDPRLDYLKTLSDDVMTVKEYNEMKDLENSYKFTTINLAGKFKVSNDKSLFNKRSDMYLFYYDDKSNKLHLDLGEYGDFTLILQGNVFIGNGSVYSKTNYSWSEDLMIELIETFKSDAVILDMGDEESGYEGEDGCDRDLYDPKVFKAGVRI